MTLWSFGGVMLVMIVVGVILGAAASSSRGADVTLLAFGSGLAGLAVNGLLIRAAVLSALRIRDREQGR